MVEDADDREEACEICDSKCQTETGLLVSWSRGRLQPGEHCGVDVVNWRGCFLEGRVTCGRLVLCLPTAGHTSAVVTGQECAYCRCFQGFVYFQWSVHKGHMQHRATFLANVIFCP